MAGYTTLKGIGQRFEAFLEPDDDEIDKFLIDVMDYIEIDLKLNIDDVIKEFIDGAIGNNYPVPSRCLRNTEIVLNRFMEKILYNGVHLEDKTQIFPTEGGTAAIVYIFNSLKRNKLVVPGDKIAINTPIFTPYLQLPGLSEFNLVETLITSDESDNWSIPETEIEKLSDPEIKAFFLVNPSNPGSKAFSQETLDALKRAVEKIRISSLLQTMSMELSFKISNLSIVLFPIIPFSFILSQNFWCNRLAFRAYCHAGR